MPMDVSSSRASNKANIFLGLIEYELNSLLGASHLIDYISVHIRFDLERYLLNVLKDPEMIEIYMFFIHIVITFQDFVKFLENRKYIVGLSLYPSKQTE